MYVVLKVQNGNGSRLVIVFFVAFSLLLPYFFSLYSVKIFFKSIHKIDMSVKRSFATHLIPSDCDPATLLPQSSKYSNLLIYCVNRYFLIFGMSQVQTPYRASTNGFLTF
mgnify:CR=1 FL=1